MSNDNDKSARGAASGEGQADKLIADNLRKVYDAVASEPVPDRFTELLKELKKKEQK